MKMEQLQMLFDYQHFASNKKLSDVIEDTASRYNLQVPGIELSDDELYLSAAGDMNAPKPKDKPDDDILTH